MTPERQKWWDSLPKEEKRVRMDIELCKKQIKWQKRNLRWVVMTGDECKMIINHNKRVIKDLRKQIAMWPVWEGDDEQDYIHCPTCGSVVACCDYSDYELPKHCEDCGQKLRWKKCVD